MELSESIKSCFIVPLIRDKLAKLQMGFRDNIKRHKLKKHHRRGASTLMYLCEALSSLWRRHCSVLSLEKNTGRVASLEYVTSMAKQYGGYTVVPGSKSDKLATLHGTGSPNISPAPCIATSQKIRQETRL